VNHLLGIKHLNAEDIQLILDTATEFKEVINRPIKSPNPSRYYCGEFILREFYADTVKF